MSTFTVGDAYEPYVGRWSRLVAGDFLGWLHVPRERRWLDVGCGTGVLLKRIREANPGLQRLTGVDFAIDDAARIEGVEYHAAMIEELPFADGAFDTVVCTHVIEHILDYRKAISELPRITRRRLIIVVPREREYRYTFNPHFNFFPYTHSFLRAMHPVPAEHECIDIGRDIFYREDKALAV